MKYTLFAATLLVFSQAADALSMHIGVAGCHVTTNDPLCQEVLINAGVSQKFELDEKSWIEVRWDHFSQPSDGFGGRNLGYDFGSILYNVEF